MKQSELLTHIIEIKESIAGLESKVEAHNGFNVRVAELEKDVTSLKTSQKLYKWIIGICVALGVGLVKAFKN